jgi:hypothetical protein
VVVLRKRDFLDLDNPLLAWMLDYDAVSAVLKALPAFKKLKQEQMEHIFDRCAIPRISTQTNMQCMCDAGAVSARLKVFRQSCDFPGAEAMCCALAQATAVRYCLIRCKIALC